jgi:hypothetical protein
VVYDVGYVPKMRRAWPTAVVSWPDRNLGDHNLDAEFFSVHTR